MEQAPAGQPGWAFRLPVIRLWELDAAAAVAGDNLALLVLSPLLGQASAPLIEQAIVKVRNQATPEQQAELLAILVLLAGPLVASARLIELVGKERLMMADVIKTLVAEQVAAVAQERDALRRALQQTVEDTVVDRFPTIAGIVLRHIRQVTATERLLQLHQAVRQAPDQAAVERVLAELAAPP